MEPQFQTGDKVEHSQYPGVRGTVVEVDLRGHWGPHIYEVLWYPKVQKKSTSRHFATALRHV